jgi:hypothetical protein
VTVSRGTLGRIQAQIARLRASLPPVVAVISTREDEAPEAIGARVSEAKTRAGARGVRVIIVDRDEEAAA